MGGDDFVAVVIPEVAEDIAKRICERFDEDRAEFYEAEDLDRGFVRMEDRKGVMQDIPLVAISIGIASTSKRQFAHYGEAVAVATEMKQFAKRDGGSRYAVDRRTRGLTPASAPGDPPSGLYSARQPVSGAGREFPTGGDSPRPLRSQRRVDPVRSRDRP